MNNDTNFEAELRALLSEGRKIEAVKLYRERTGAGLKEAKDAVETIERGESVASGEALDSSLEAEMVSLLEGGKKVEAIKLYRERTGTGLKEAKDAVEAIAADRHIATSSGPGCLGVVLLLAAILVLSLASPVFVHAADTAKPAAPIEVYFSPNGGCMDAILGELKAAKSNVLVQAYWFTSARITDALVEAHKRGVKVEVILDRGRAEKHGTQAKVLVGNGVPTLIDDRHTTAHSKVIIIDGQVVITGSFNFTEQAEKENLENLLVIRDKAVAEKFVANWKDHREHSVHYGKK